MPSRSRVLVFIIFAVAPVITVAISGTVRSAFAEPATDAGPNSSASPNASLTSCPSPTSTPSPGDTSPSGTPSPSSTQTLAIPAIALGPVNSVLSFDNQHPVIAGTVTELEPGGSTPVPYANQEVILADSVLGSVQVRTDTSGDFSFAPYAHPVSCETFTVQVPATASTAAAQTTPVTFSVRTDPVKLAAALSATKICYCGKVSVSGTVRYAPAATYQPLPGQRVRVLANGTQVASAVTSATGHFSAALPREPASLTWTVQAGGGPYLETAAARLPMTVELPTAVSAFQLSLNQYWQVSFHGCVSLTPGTPGAIASLAGLAIQYSAGRNGPWHTLGAVPSQHSAPCGHAGLTFGGTLNARLNYAYYRAVYPGGTNRAGTRYLPATSGKVLAWKYADRFTSFKVSSHSVHKGGKLTVSGRLQFYASGWRNFGRQQVQVILRPQGSKNWYWIVRGKTNPHGDFSATFTDPVSATWAVEYLGDKAHLAAVSAMTFVRLTG